MIIARQFIGGNDLIGVFICLQYQHEFENLELSSTALFL